MELKRVTLKQKIYLNVSIDDSGAETNILDQYQ